MVTTKINDVEPVPKIKSVKSGKISFLDFYEYFTHPIYFNIDLEYVLSVIQKYKSDCDIPVRELKR